MRPKSGGGAGEPKVAIVCKNRPLKCIRIRLLVFAAISTGLATSGCRGQAAPGASTSIAPFAPPDTMRLRDLGAFGDGSTDDTAALQRALASSDRYCLNGEGRTYRVSGTLRVDKDLCLRNVVLAQSFPPVDTAAYITHACRQTFDTSAVIDCGDPPIPAGVLTRLRQSLSLRTLLIRPAEGSSGIRVTLDHVRVDRGPNTDSGSRADSAGIWLQGADRADLSSVEITGGGKGYGLMVLQSRNVTVDNLSIHDLVWSPYRGERPLTQARVAAAGWNSLPIHEFREAGQDGVRTSKFYGVRVQEQITCADFSQVQNLVIRNPHVLRCMARLADGEIPWQADGLDIAQASSNVTVDGAVIDSTWDGMDIVANDGGLDGLTISNVRASNSFSYGLKLGYRLRNARIANAVITNSGIAGIVIYGPVAGITVFDAQISGVGLLAANGRTFVPWPALPHAGIRIDEGSRGTQAAGLTPRDVTIDGVTISNPSAVRYDFGLLNTGGSNIRVRRFHSVGFSKAQMSGAIQTVVN